MTNYLHYDPLQNDHILPAAQRSKNLYRLEEQLKEQAKHLSNSQVLEDYTILLRSDAWNGVHSPGGAIALEVLTEELEARLRYIGFLPKETALL